MIAILNTLPASLIIQKHLKAHLMADRFFTQTLLARLLCFIVISGGFSTYIFAQSAGTVDTAFGTSGKVITPLGSISDKGYSIVIQSDSKIILGGTSTTSFSSFDFALTRYNNDGTMDNTFGTGGKVITPVTAKSEGHSVAIQSDGKILLGGSDKWYTNLVRYTSDGSLDTTFGIGGIVITDVPGHYSEKCRSVAIQTDGKIIIGGYASNNSNDKRYFVLIRYTIDGSLDTAFGAGGIVIGGIGECESIKVQGNGKILMAGTSNLSIALERYNSNGTLDTTFGTGGNVSTAIGSSSRGFSLDIQADDRVVLGGYANTNGSNFDFALARYDTNGVLDNTFGIGGIVTTPVGIASKGNSVVIQSDGKIILAGEANNGSNTSNFALVRYFSDGTLDTTFGTGGKTITPIGNSYSIAESLGIDSNGKIILGGYAYNGSSLEMALVRYHGKTSVGIEEDPFKQSAHTIFPNPFNSSAIIQLNSPLYNAELTIYNAYGQIVNKVKNISGYEILLSRNNLATGMYFLQLIENNEVIVTDKLVIGDE